MSAETASLVLSALAIAVSVIVFLRQDGLQSRLAKIEEDRRDEEVASRLVGDLTARFEVEVDPRSGKRRRFLVLDNRGPARAEDVDFETPDPDEGGPIIRSEDLTLSGLDPGQTFGIPCIFHSHIRPSVPVTLRWRDGRGPQEKTLDLSTA
jgi:hypothetical protein